jgi:hypothetical protein
MCTNLKVTREWSFEMNVILKILMQLSYSLQVVCSTENAVPN